MANACVADKIEEMIDIFKPSTWRLTLFCSLTDIICRSIWRNFRHQYGDVLSADSLATTRNTKQDKDVVNEGVASLYPIVIPSPSQIGDFTYAKFLSESPLIKNKKLRLAVVRQVQKDYDEFRRLRLRSELRDPPLTSSGEWRHEVLANFCQSTFGGNY